MVNYNVGVLGRPSGAIGVMVDYLKGVSFARQAINNKLPQVLEDAGGIVLDIGGSGDLCKMVRQDYYVVLDQNPAATTTITADAGATPFRTGTVARVLCISVLEHADNPLQILKESYRILQPGGQLFLSVPWLFESHMEPHDFWRFSKWQMDRWLAGEAFEVVSAEAVNGRAGLLAHLLQDRTWTRWSIGLVVAAVQVVGKSRSFRYTTQLNYLLRRPVVDPLVQLPVKHWADAVACNRCHSDAAVMRLADDMLNCSSCGHQVLRSPGGGFNFLADLSRSRR